MWKRKLGMLGGLLVVVLVLAMLTSCVPNTSKPPLMSVIVVPASRSVKFLDPNETYRVKVRSAVLDVGYYLELAELENDVAAGRLKRKE